MPAVGAILGVAILVGPAATARLIAPRLSWIPPIAAFIGVLSGVAGLWISREFGVAAGGAIGLVVSTIFVIVLLGRALFVGRRGTERVNFATVGATRSSRKVSDAAAQT
jgi:ABC-type Mn2+/Zn2+ transport system permease subunit